MVTFTYTVGDENGIHARPAGALACLLYTSELIKNLHLKSKLFYIKALLATKKCLKITIAIKSEIFVPAPELKVGFSKNSKGDAKMNMCA